MALSNMQVFEQYMYGSMTETVDQKVDLFNQASRGALMLETMRHEGDFASETFWQNIPGLVRRRDAYGSGAQTGVALAQEDLTKVKVASGTPPILFEPQQLTWIQKRPEEAGTVIGEQLGVAMVQDQVNTAIRSLNAAIQDPALIHDDNAASPAIRSDLVSAASLFGDRAGEITAWIMHSKVMHDLYQENVANVGRLFTIGNVNVMEDGFGRVLIMTDSPDLVNGAEYTSLGLVNGAVCVYDNDDFFSYLDTQNGNENIERSFQAEYTFNVKVKGYGWNRDTGGASPDDAALALPANWEQKYTFAKDTAGVKFVTA